MSAVENQSLENDDITQVTVNREFEQLPIITQRTYAERLFGFLFACYTTALLVQLLCFVPIVAPIAERLPFLAIGGVMVAASLQLLAKAPVTRAVLAGIIVGSVLGL